MLVIISGVVLMIYYVPVTDQAYHSIERIQFNWRWGPVPVGAMVRGLVVGLGVLAVTFTEP